MKAGKCDKVVLVVCVEVQDGMADLANVDRARERGLLCVVTLQTDSVLLVPDAVCGHGRVMRDLLTDELSDSNIVFLAAEEELAEEGVERLLFAAQLLVS